MGLEKVDCFVVIRQLDVREQAEVRQSFEAVRAMVFLFRARRRIGSAEQLCHPFNCQFEALRPPQPTNEYLSQIGTERITIQSAVSNQMQAMVDKLAQLKVLRF